MTSSQMRQRFASLLATCERPSRYLDHEYNAIYKEEDTYSFHAVMIYPDVYEVGQPNQAVAILYDTMNKMRGVFCERSYLPWVDMIEGMRTEGLPLVSLETFTPLASFDLLGITLPHEMAYTNVLELLDLSDIPLRANKRCDNDPLVIGGGPCVYNPEQIAPFFDAIVIGEGEEAIIEVVELLQRLKAEGACRAEKLIALAAIEGVYVPSLYDVVEGRAVPCIAQVPAIVHKRVLADFDVIPVNCAPIVPYEELVHDRFNVEVLRGCCRGCRFCQAGMIYRPVRERGADAVIAASIQGLRCTGYDEVSLTSLSTTDHSQIESILRRLNHAFEDQGIAISVPSQRLDRFGVEMARLVAGSKKGGLTLAPEAGTQRLRDRINKNVTEDELMNAITHAFEAGWRHAKLYFMIGLPGETDDDIVGIAELANAAYARAKECVPDNERGTVRLGISCAVFVPKAATPFQWCGQIPYEEVKRRISLLLASRVHKAIDIRWHDPETSFIEAAMARGGREMADVIEEAWRHGARFDAWTEHFSFARWLEAGEATGVDLVASAQREWKLDEPLPWDHISCGVHKEYLVTEYERAQRGETTPDCSFVSCTGCGVCSDLGVNTVLAGECRG
jgi:radical SAM family uncharacterized protein